MKILLAVLLPLAMISPAAGQQVIQSGKPLPGHAARWITNLTIGDAGPANGGPPGTGLTELNITSNLNNDLPFCINDAPITGPYHQLCLGAGGASNLSYNAYGGASPLPLVFNVNGTSYNFPGPGTGNVLGPNTSTINEISSFNNATGTLLRQGPARITDSQTAPIAADASASAGYSQSGVTSQAIYNQAVMSGSATNFQGYDAVRGVSVAPASSSVNIIAGVTGYTLNNTVPVSQRSTTSSLNGIAVCAVNSSLCWGINTITSDNPTLSNTGVTTGTGKYLYNEFDLNITSPNTGGAALQVGGTALPTNITLPVSGVTVQKLWGAGGAGTGTALFSNGFFLWDACCAIGLSVGATATSGANANSMPIYMNYRAANSSYQNVTLQVLPSGAGAGGTLFLNGSDTAVHLDLVKGNIYLPSNSNVSFNNNAALTSDGASVVNLANSAPWTSLGLGAVGTTVTINGPANIGAASTTTSINSGTTILGSPATGTPAASICLDASNHIIKKTTAGSCI